MSPAGRPIRCREPGCDVRIHFARSQTTGRNVPLEVRDRPPFTQEATGALVVVSGQAWRPLDLMEHFRVRNGIDESKARDLVAGYPHHRIHSHQERT